MGSLVYVVPNGCQSERQIWYLDVEHEEFHSLAKWEDFIADPGQYLNGRIVGEFEE